MGYVEIEVKARTVDLAIAAAMQELGVEDKEQLAVTVIQEPEKGFLGMGGQDAIVHVKKQQARRSRRDRGKNNRGDSSDKGTRKQNSGTRGASNGKNTRTNQGKSQKPKGRDMSRDDRSKPAREDDRDVLTIEKQTEIVKEFLEGLVGAYGLEGDVVTKVEDEVIVVDVTGEQTEALVGVRGSVRSAIHELTRTVLQRYAQDTARLRLDIAGYAERRREALTIYAKQLIDQLEAEGGELMLEPMSSADRKVIHDAAAASNGVESYSEGEPPRRYVVLAKKGSSEEE